MAVFIYLATYVSNAQYLFHWVLSYYFHYGVYCALRNLITRCSKQTLTFTSFELKRLCIIVERVNQWLAYPLLYFFIASTVDLVQGCCLILTTPLDHTYQMVVHHWIVLAIEFGIVFINHRNQELIRQICHRLKQRNQCRTQVGLINRQNSRVIIMIHELWKTYLEHSFAIQVFQLTKVDFRFLFQMSLFVLNLTVFILQTDNR